MQLNLNIDQQAMTRQLSAQETDDDGQARFHDAASAMHFMLGGNARLTFVSRKTGTRFTYRVRASDDGQIHFVSLMNGPDNETAYAYFGYIRRGVYFHGGAKARVSRDAPSAKAFEWVYHFLAKGEMKEDLEIWHEGRCGRCGRALTVPESIRTGFGPECAGRMGL